MNTENPREWITVETDEKAAVALASELSTPLPVARLLVSRGFTNIDNAELFLSTAEQSWRSI